MDFSEIFFKEATPGKRLKLLRKLRGYTQKEFGTALGFPEKSADIRVAQYENGSRCPKDDTLNKMAKLLKVSPVTLSPTVCTSCDELIHSLFWLHYTKGSDAIYDCIKEWQSMYNKFQSGEINPFEYLEWGFTYQSSPSGSPE